MQVAIFLVLVLIAVILAPWLLGVIAAVAAAFGAVAVIAGAVVVAAIVCYLGYLAYKGELFGTKEWRSARRMKKLTDASNRRFREKNE